MEGDGFAPGLNGGREGAGEPRSQVDQIHKQVGGLKLLRAGAAHR